MKEEIKKELEELSPFLSNLPKKENFELPFNYFESLQDKVIDKANPIIEQKISWVDKLINRVFNKRMAIGIVTSVLLISGFWFFSKRDTSLPNYETIAKEITAEAFNEYIIEEIDDFTLETLQEMDIDFSVSFDEIDSIDDELLDKILDDFEDFELEQI